MRVGDLMTRAVVSIDPDETLDRVREIMQDGGFHHVLVVDDGRLVGVISDRDVLRSMSPFLERELMNRRQDENTLRRKAHQLMTRHPQVAREDEPASEAAKRILEHRVGCLPVVDAARRVRGILTWRDLLAAAWPEVADGSSEAA